MRWSKVYSLFQLVDFVKHPVQYDDKYVEKGVDSQGNVEVDVAYKENFPPHTTYINSELFVAWMQNAEFVIATRLRAQVIERRNCVNKNYVVHSSE